MNINKLTGLLVGTVALTGLSFLTSNATTVNAKSSRYVAVKQNQQQRFILTLKNRDSKGLDKLIEQTVTPGSPNYHKYLTSKQFGAQYGLSNQNVKVVGKYFSQHHLKTQTINGNLIMTVSGSTKNVEKALNVKLYQKQGKTWLNQRTVGRIGIPKKVAKHISYVMEVNKDTDTRGKQHSYAIDTTNTNNSNDNQQLDANLSDQSPSKFARNYDAEALYQQGFKGKGQTIGIVTQAGFKQSDVNQFLQKQGVTNNNRIKQYFTGGQTFGADRMETTLDVEQASTIAPDANVNVYVDDGLVGAYATAIGRDNVDALSISFGDFENAMQKDPDSQGEIPTLNLLFKQAAAQGITNFAGAGDWGAYGFPDGTTSLAPFFPSSSPYVTSVGGTTLPFKNLKYSDILNMQIPGLGKYLTNDKSVSLNQERAWSNATLTQLFGKDYMQQANREVFTNLSKTAGGKKLLTKLAKQVAKVSGQSSSKTKQYSTIQGTGGGFSNLFAKPDYQKGISGVGTYNARQFINFKNGDYNINAKLISGTKTGRNLPDISGAADGLTGYEIYYNGRWIKNVSGTSIVGPQMAAMATVINNAQGVRTGFWNPQIYRFAKTSNSPFTPLNSLDDNNNYYVGQPGKIYNQATGLGTVNFDKLNQAFSSQNK
ncbi:S53 family peptidase [Lactobacillaceae bacterium Scapto_B20]